jgi:hypothetical protein
LKIEPKTGLPPNSLHSLQPSKHIEVSPLAAESPYGIICQNNPLIYTDPSGEFIVELIIIGAIMGAMMGAAQADMAGTSILEGVAKGAVIGAVSGAVADFTGGLVTQILTQTVQSVGAGAVTAARIGPLNRLCSPFAPSMPPLLRVCPLHFTDLRNSCCNEGDIEK